MKPLGSLLFETTEMKADECVLYAKVCKKNGMTPEETLLEIHAIDEMLILIKIESLSMAMSRTPTGRLRRNHLLSDQIERRVQILIDDEKLLKQTISC